MRYLIAILLPCLGVLFVGRWFLALVLAVAQLTIIGWLPAAIVAVLVIHDRQADRRMRLAAR